MAIIRNEHGQLVVDGKVIPKYQEQLYLRRGCGAVGDSNKDFPAKSQADKIVDIDGCADIVMPGGEVDHISNLDDKDLPDHPECRVPETLREVREAANEAAGYAFMGVKLDPDEQVENEPVEEGPSV